MNILYWEEKDGDYYLRRVPCRTILVVVSHNRFVDSYLSDGRYLDTIEITNGIEGEKARQIAYRPNARFVSQADGEKLSLL